MKSDETGGIVIIFVACFCVMISVFGGYKLGTSNMQKQAIAHSAAIYVYDSSTNQTTFEWKNINHKNNGDNK
jgi:hypothetical protein